MSALILSLCVAVLSHTVSSRRSRRLFSQLVTVDDVGVKIWPDLSPEAQRINRMARELIDSATCAEETYASGCSGDDPEGCPCTSFNDTERTQILDAHNYRRELAAAGEELCSNSDNSGTENCPAATDMNALIWDDQLEIISTYWAHQFCALPLSMSMSMDRV